MAQVLRLQPELKTVLSDLAKLKAEGEPGQPGDSAESLGGALWTRVKWLKDEIEEALAQFMRRMDVAKPGHDTSDPLPETRRFDFCYGALLCQAGKADASQISLLGEQQADKTPLRWGFICQHCFLEVADYSAVRFSQDGEPVVYSEMLAACHVMACASFDNRRAYYKCLACFGLRKDVNFSSASALEKHMETHPDYSFLRNEAEVVEATRTNIRYYVLEPDHKPRIPPSVVPTEQASPWYDAQEVSPISSPETTPWDDDLAETPIGPPLTPQSSHATTAGPAIATPVRPSTPVMPPAPVSAVPVQTPKPPTPSTPRTKPQEEPIQLPTRRPTPPLVQLPTRRPTPPPVELPNRRPTPPPVELPSRRLTPPPVELPNRRLTPPPVELPIARERPEVHESVELPGTISSQQPTQELETKQPVPTRHELDATPPVQTSVGRDGLRDPSPHRQSQNREQEANKTLPLRHELGDPFPSAAEGRDSLRHYYSAQQVRVPDQPRQLDDGQTAPPRHELSATALAPSPAPAPSPVQESRRQSSRRHSSRHHSDSPESPPPQSEAPNVAPPLPWSPDSIGFEPQQQQAHLAHQAYDMGLPLSWSPSSSAGAQPQQQQQQQAQRPAQDSAAAPNPRRSSSMGFAPPQQGQSAQDPRPASVATHRLSPEEAEAQAQAQAQARAQVRAQARAQVLAEAEASYIAAAGRRQPLPAAPTVRPGRPILQRDERAPSPETRPGLYQRLKQRSSGK